MADFHKEQTVEEEKLPCTEQGEDILFMASEEEPQPSIETVDKKNKNGIWGELFDCFETFCYSLVLIMILFVFVFRFVTVNGYSMTNTLQSEDKLIISGLIYTPETGDIVVIDADGIFADRYIIKRIIATGGQTVEIDFKEWKVRVDNVLLDEDYVKRTVGIMNTEEWIQNDDGVSRRYENGVLVGASFTVPKGKIFVMGDNRNGSSDSRMIGFLEEDRIMGRVLLRIAPNFGRVE